MFRELTLSIPKKDLSDSTKSILSMDIFCPCLNLLFLFASHSPNQTFLSFWSHFRKNDWLLRINFLNWFEFSKFLKILRCNLEYFKLQLQMIVIPELISVCPILQKYFSHCILLETCSLLFLSALLTYCWNINQGSADMPEHGRSVTFKWL